MPSTVPTPGSSHEPVIDAIILFKKHIIAHNPTARQARIQSVQAGLDKLFSYEDTLTLLILENVLIDIIHSRLKIIIHYDHDWHPGSFSKITRVIGINDSSVHEQFSITNDASILLHEMSHAISCFAFRTDPFAMKQFFDDMGYGKTVAAKAAVDKSMEEFITYPLLPYPPECSDTKLYKNGYKLFKERFNPAELKFKQCVREDAAKIKANNYFRFPEDKDFDTLAWNFQMSIYHDSLSADPEELFSRYMECRLHLLRKAEENAIPHDKVFTHLEEISTKLHDYFETDVKKLLHHRLVRYNQITSTEFVSLSLQKYAQTAPDVIQEFFQKDGTLKFSLWK